MSIESDLEDIRGIGEAKRKEIMTVFEDYQNQQGAEYPPEVAKAYDYLQEGRPGYAKKFLRRVVDE